MTNLEVVSGIALMGAAIMVAYFIFKIFLFALFRKSIDFITAFQMLTVAYHFFYIFLFYSGALSSIPWLSGTELFNQNINIFIYIVYIRITLLKYYKFEFVDLFVFLPFLIQLTWFFLSVYISPYLYEEYIHEYISNSVPDAFPIMNFMIFPVLSNIFLLIINLRWLLKVSGGIGIDTISNVLKNKKSVSNYLFFSILFATTIRISYNLCAWAGGRTLAIYYTSVEIILMIIIVTSHEILPLLVKARLLKPIDDTYEKCIIDKFESGFIQRILYLMENEKPFIEETFQMETLAMLLGISKHQTSAIINQHFHCSFPEFLHRYRIEEAKKILIEKMEIKSSIIGFEVGYKSISSFYSSFYKKTGMSPQEFREQYSQNGKNQIQEPESG